LLVGLSFAACARVQFTSGQKPWGRELQAVLSFETILVWPISIYFFAVFPDWSWMYLVDPHKLPYGVSVLVLLAFGTTLVGGYLIGWALLRSGRERWLHAALAVVTVVLVAFAVACRSRLLHGATYAEFQSGHALSFRDARLHWAMAITTPGVLAGAALVGFTLWEQGKRR
jgi:hypothetical protein